MRRSRTPLALLFAVLIIALTAVGASRSRVPFKPPGNGYAYLDDRGVQARLWHLPCVSALIESAYDYEIALLDYSQPVADQDAETCGVPGHPVILPGKPWDHYGYAGAINVSGSGYVLKLITPNGGHLSLLHLETVYAPTAGTVAFHGPIPKGLDDATGLALQGVKTMPTLPTALTFHGGQTVGLTGYPSDPQYGNGLAGFANSQLCQLSDAAAQNWLLQLAQGRDRPNPHPPFPYKEWKRKTSHVPAYHKHHVTRVASYWQRHRRQLGYVLSRKYVKQVHHAPYYVYTFQYERVFVWPGHPHWRLKVVGRK